MTPDLFDTPIPERYPSHPGSKTGGTSEEAAKAVAGSSERARGMILSWLWTVPPRTADEIAEHFGWSVLYTRPRVSELHKLKAIKKAGRRSNPSSNLSANTWTIA